MSDDAANLFGHAPDESVTALEIAARTGRGKRAVQNWIDDGVASGAMTLLEKRTNGGPAKAVLWKEVVAYLENQGLDVVKRSSRLEKAPTHGSDGADESHGSGAGVVDAAGAKVESVTPEHAGALFEGTERTELEMLEELRRRLGQVMENLLPLNTVTGKVDDELWKGHGDAERLAGSIKKFSSEMRQLDDFKFELMQRSREYVLRSDAERVCAALARVVVGELEAIAADLPNRIMSLCGDLIPEGRALEARRLVGEAARERGLASRSRIADSLTESISMLERGVA